MVMCLEQCPVPGEWMLIRINCYVAKDSMVAFYFVLHTWVLPMHIDLHLGFSLNINRFYLY